MIFIRIGIYAAVAAVLYAIALLVFSESGEVVVLRTFERDGRQHETRLWIV